MKKLLMIAVAAIALAITQAAPAGAAPGVVVILAGGEEADTISIGLTSSAPSAFIINSASPLEVGGGVCVHPEGMPNTLLCDAVKVSGFEVNAGGGEDHVTMGRSLGVPVTLRGGPGNDELIGGGSVLGDKLVGGPGDDVLMGRAGSDLLYGGPGDDRLSGGQDDDRLVGGSGKDVLNGDAGEDVLIGLLGEDVLIQ